MKCIKKLDWKKKLMLSVLVSALLVILLLFSATYYYFLGKLGEANEKLVRLSFQETEKNLGDIIDMAEMCLSRLSNHRRVWEFSEGEYESSAQRSVSVKMLVNSFDEMISQNGSIEGFGIWNGDGKCAVSTGVKSRTGYTEVRGEMKGLLRRCRENYPYVLWVGSRQLDIPEQAPMYCLTEEPALVGLKALGEASEYLEDSYLVVTLSEEKVQKSFEQVVYNDSSAVLLDQDEIIMSATDSALLGSRFVPDSGNQNIRYELSGRNWTLVNMIPLEQYQMEARGIRNVGIALGVAAFLAITLFAVVWSRRYVRPIQTLMEQFDSVGKEHLDIPVPKKEGWPELARLNEEFYLTVQKLRDYIRRLQEAEQEKAVEELRTLQYQINPHFLYNSLNSIRWMAMMTNSTKVADSLTTLSRLIMPVLRNPGFTWTLREELQFLSNYVEMMQLRYGNDMDYSLECPEEILGETFPRFILQPVIENCFVHGGAAGEGRQVLVRISRPDGHFSVMVQNTGVFIEEDRVREINDKIVREEVHGKNLGLANVHRRLKLLCGSRAGIRLESEPETGVTVRMNF